MLALFSGCPQQSPSDDEFSPAADTTAAVPDTDSTVDAGKSRSAQDGHSVRPGGDARHGDAQPLDANPRVAPADTGVAVSVDTGGGGDAAQPDATGQPTKEDAVSAPGTYIVVGGLKALPGSIAGGPYAIEDSEFTDNSSCADVFCVVGGIGE